MEPDSFHLDRQLAHYLRSRATASPGTERVGPFVARFDLTSVNPYLNYSIPDDDADPTSDDVASLIDLASRKGRIPRVEYFPGAAPKVEAALLEAGFVTERWLPVMCCSRSECRALPSPDGISIAAVRAEIDEDLAGAALAASLGFDEPAPDQADIDRLRRSIGSGGRVVLARDNRTDDPVGSAQFSPPVDGITEIVGVSVIPEYRRRGIASAMTAALLGPELAPSVDTAWLSPEDEGAAEVYRAVGFKTLTRVLHARGGDDH